MSFERAKAKGLTSALTFPRGNLCPDGSVIKSTSIDPSVVDADGVYRKTGPAKVFTTEKAAIAAIKGQGPVKVQPGDVRGPVRRGPMGSGMEETYQLTSALKYISWGKQVAVLTDARFSGVSTGACIGHVSPEALAGGPIGKLRDGDRVQIVIDRNELRGHRRPGRATRPASRPRVGYGRTGPARSASGPGPGPGAAGRYAAVGGAAKRQRRRLGRVRVRPDGDRRKLSR